MTQQPNTERMLNILNTLYNDKPRGKLEDKLLDEYVDHLELLGRSKKWEDQIAYVRCTHLLGAYYLSQKNHG